MLVAFASGKGGTGKTLCATCLADYLARYNDDVAYVDADVEEPNGFLFLRPLINRVERMALPLPKLKTGVCSGCGECQRFCAYNAILAVKDGVIVFPELCHSCGGCLRVCPEDALEEWPREVGTFSEGMSGKLTCFSGRLDVGEARAAPVIEQLLDRIPGNGPVIVDAPPGTSCSAMAAVKRADLVVLVTEPTPFGLHDLRLAVEICRILNRAVVAVINRSDLGDERAEEYLEGEGIGIIARLPFQRKVADAYAAGRLAYEYSPELKDAVKLLAGEVHHGC